MNKALIFIDSRYNEINPITFQLLGKILSINEKCEVIGVLINENTQNFKEDLIGYPFTIIHGYDTNFSTDVYAKIMIKSIEKYHPDLVLIGSSDLGKNIAGIVATNFKTGLTADCTDLRMDDKGNIIQIRPAFGGDVMCQILTENSRPQMATIRNNVYEAIKRSDKEFNTIFIFEKIKLESKIKILSVKNIERDIDISKEKKLLAIGNGLKNKKDLKIVEELCVKLGFVLCCSRACVEKGFLPQNRQVGLSGSTVNPDVMITVGVSGSVQFMAGVKGVKKLIAINSDENARIFNYAHYSIEGNLYDIIPELLNQIN
jgi:electron transfer flavoprotein alpha subunit